VIVSLTPISAIIHPNLSWGAAMSETLERMQERARELARSGKFSGWRSVAFELQFEPGLKEVFQWRHSASAEDAFLWLYSSTAKEELDRLCLDRLCAGARNPEAA
jgi:hypothetical protein